MKEVQKFASFNEWSIQPWSADFTLSQKDYEKFWALERYFSVQNKTVSEIDMEKWMSELSQDRTDILTNFNKYMNLDEWMNWIDLVKENHEGDLPNGKLTLTVGDIGNSYENRPIRSLVFKGPRSSEKRPSIAIDCAIHSREWISPAMCRYIINGKMLKILDRYSTPTLAGCLCKDNRPLNRYCGKLYR